MSNVTRRSFEEDSITRRSSEEEDSPTSVSLLRNNNKNSPSSSEDEDDTRSKSVNRTSSLRRFLLQQYARVNSIPVYTQVILSIIALGFFPFVFWGGHLPFDDFVSYCNQVVIGWDALLHVRIWPLVVMILIRAIMVAHQASTQQTTPCIKKQAAIVTILFFVVTIFGSNLQIVVPSWLWNPFLWGNMNIYYPKDLSTYMQGMCLEQDTSNSYPLCLPPVSWKVLGGEVLDPRNPADVAAVKQGIQYARTESDGLVINVMSRDTIDAIEPLRYNVEAIAPFFENKLAVVIFENDSKDGTREAFKQWAKEAKGYKVDLMTCGEEYPDCQFGLSHRYDSTEAKEYFKSSAIGKMTEFRQRIVDYVNEAPAYADYSHMLVMDLDLQVSLSPLGLMHSLGTVQDAAVASSGRQTWPGSLGTLTPPYDFSAFRALETPTNKNLLALHQRFCELMPPGDRWRNQCDAVSPMQLMLVLGRDRLIKDEPYPVESAFNGATLYPLKLVRETGAKYDAGDDGQRCEHIGFNLGLQKPMYVDPKWNFHIDPVNPGGPTGFRAYKNFVRIVFTPQISLCIGAQTASSLFIFVISLMVLGVHVVYPLFTMSSRHCKLPLPLTQQDVRVGNPMWPPFPNFRRPVKHV